MISLFPVPKSKNGYIKRISQTVQQHCNDKIRVESVNASEQKISLVAVISIWSSQPAHAAMKGKMINHKKLIMSFHTVFF